VTRTQAGILPSFSRFGGPGGCVARIQMTTLMNSVNKIAQARVGLSALNTVLRAATGALLRLSVLGKRQFLAENWIVAALLISETVSPRAFLRSDLLGTTAVLMI